MPHPSRRDIEALVDKRLNDNALIASVKSHLAACEFCREYADEYREHEQEVRGILSQPDSEELKTFLRALSQTNQESKIISLRLLENTPIQRRASLAADSKNAEPADLAGIATLYSENPEVVMKLMHDSRSGSDYLQLISDSPELVSNVLVRAPQIPAEWVTDINGKAELSTKAPANAGLMQWQICLPEATFDLEPLIYDPEKIEYLKESVLETERGDKIKITFAGKSSGKQIVVELLELEHRTDFKSVRVILLGEGRIQSHSAAAGQRVLFEFPENTKDINIRIYQ